ncbi:MAG: ABC-type transport system, permease component [Verrucomicrobiales bacterium]|nr:ABC-type transport system, permease component [Verrucomicrobiales bacterium]
MNEPNPQPPVIPPGTLNLGDSAYAPLGSNPNEQIPITGILTAFEAILRQPRRVLFHLTQANAKNVIGALLMIFVIASVIYGFVAGTFSGHDQLWAAPAKVVLGLFISAAICLPSLYIFACLNGSQARLYEVAGLVAGLLALTTILLIGFAPVAWIFSQSTDSVVAMGVLHLSFWFIATCFGLRFLDSGFRHFSGSFGVGIKIWTVIFLLVVLQMTTALRPIIGRAPTFLPTEKKFFLSHWSDTVSDSNKAAGKKSDQDYR